jgi:hypothetical protein
MDQKDFNIGPSGNELRFKMLETSAGALGFKPTSEFPRVYGVTMDWNVGGMISSTIAMCDGNASIHGPAINISDNLKTQRVRDAAKSCILEAEKHHDNAVAAIDHSYPKLGCVRFYILCFDGIRVIESTESSLRSGKDTSSSLWKTAQVLIYQMRTDTSNSAKQSNASNGFFNKKNWIDLLLGCGLVLLLSYRFIGRTFLGSGAWLTEDDAARTPMNGIAHFVVDNNTWLLVPLIGFLVFAVASNWNKHSGQNKP